MTETPNREALLAHGDELWHQLRAALDAHLREPLGPSSDWTGHDVYAHFARWQGNTIAAVREGLAGRRPEPPDEDEDTINNRWRAEDHARPTEDVRAECERTRAELRALLMTLSERQWAAWGGRAAADIGGEHYEHHLAVIGERSAP